MNKYYFAHDTNVDPETMTGRCPAARLVGPATLLGYRLVFCRTADVQDQEDAQVQGVLWDLSPACEQALDSFHGYPFLHGKEHVTVTRQDGSQVQALIYQLQFEIAPEPPDEDYLETIQTGYAALGLPVELVERAVSAANIAAIERKLDSLFSNWEPDDDEPFDDCL